jgi:excisionase family DNA binding protein
MHETMPPDAIGLPEAGKLIAVSAATIRRWIMVGRLAGFRAGCHWKVSKEDVLSLVTRPAPIAGPALTTKAEKRAHDAEVDCVLRDAGIRK